MPKWKYRGGLTNYTHRTCIVIFHKDSEQCLQSLVKPNACYIPHLAIAMNFKVIQYVVSEINLE